MSNKITCHDVERLREIQSEISDLVHEAYSIVLVDEEISAKAKGYWFAHIDSSLDTNNEFLGGGSMHSLQDSIEQLEERYSDEEGL